MDPQIAQIRDTLVKITRREGLKNTQIEASNTIIQKLITFIARLQTQLETARRDEAPQVVRQADGNCQTILEEIAPLVAELEMLSSIPDGDDPTANTDRLNEFTQGEHLNIPALSGFVNGRPFPPPPAAGPAAGPVAGVVRNLREMLPPSMNPMFGRMGGTKKRRSRRKRKNLR